MRISEKDGAVRLAIYLQPRASRDAIAGEYRDGLKIRVTAPPVEGRANEALRRLLATTLKVSIAAVRIVSGESSRSKLVEIAGVTPAMVRALVE